MSTSAGVGLGISAQVLPGVYITPNTHINFAQDQYVTTQTRQTVETENYSGPPPTLQLNSEGDGKMATAGTYPAAQTTTTTTTTTRVAAAPCNFDSVYLRTVPGILKITEMVVDLVGFICIMTPSWFASVINWYSFVAMTGFWVTGSLLVFYLFHLIERLHMVPWMLVEFVYGGLWSVFFLIAGALAASKGAYHGGFAAASFFGFCGVFVYGYDSFLKFQGWRAGQVAQGQRTVTTTSQPTLY